MADIPLQVSFHTDLVSGGYGRRDGRPMYNCTTGDCFNPKDTCDLVEVIDGTCGYWADNPDWHDVQATGSDTRTYRWRDSNSGLNSKSSEGYATIRDTWSAKPDDQNNLIITHDMYLVAWGRRDLVTRGGAIIAAPGRGLAVYKAVNGQYTMVQNLGTSMVNQTYERTGNIHIGTFTYVLPPQSSSRGQYPNTGTLVRNWVIGKANDQPYRNADERYIDMMFMGADFRNNLPNQFLPPVLDHIEQIPDICEDFVIFQVYFEAPIMSGANLEFEYWYNGETVDDARKITVDGVKAGEPIYLEFDQVYPSRNHDVKLYWRARFVATTGTLKDSDWTYGSEEVIFIPPPNMTVPDITTAECTAITRGELIPPYEEITWYGKENE